MPPAPPTVDFRRGGERTAFHVGQALLRRGRSAGAEGDRRAVTTGSVPRERPRRDWLWRAWLLVAVAAGWATSAWADSGQEGTWPLAGTSVVQRYPIERTGVAGRPRVITQLVDRRLAVGTDRGLFLYDGQRWENVPGQSGVSSILSLPDGRIFVGTGGEVFELRPDGRGGFAARPTLGALLRDRPESIVFSLQVLEGVIYALDGLHLMLVPIDGRPSTRVDLPTWCEGGFVSNGAYYVRTAEPDEPLRRFDPSTRTLAFAPELLPPELQERLVAHSVDHTGRVWFATESGRFFSTDGRGHEVFPGAIPAAHRPFQIETMQALPRGGLAVATIERGVFLFDAEGVMPHRPLGLEHGGAASRIYALGVDGTDGLWLGAGLELTRIDGSFATTLFTEADGLSGEVWAIERFQGRLYVATDTGLFRQNLPAAGADAPAFEPLPVAPPVRSLARVADGLWVAAHHVLLLNDAGEWRDFGPATLGPNPIVAWRGRRDYVVAGVRDGLRVFRRVGRNWQDAGPVPGVNRRVFSLAQTAAGDLWASFGSGALARIQWRAGEWDVREFGLAHGLPNRWLHLGARENDVWVGSDVGTLAWDASAERFGPSDGLIFYGHGEPFGFDPVFSDQESAWVWPQTTVATLVRRPRAEVLTAISVATGHLRARSRSLLREPDGTVWVGLPNGLLRDMPPLEPPREGGRVQLRRLVDLQTGQPIRGAPDQGETIELEARQNSIRVEAALPDFAGDRLQQFQVQLQGFEEEAPFTAYSFRDYANLAPGRYELKVAARDGAGRAAGTLRLPLVVRAPAYATGWAWAAYLLLGSTMILSLVRWREVRIRRHAHTLQSAVDERTAALSRQTTLLVEEKKLFASLAAAAPVGIWHGDGAGRIVFVNPALAAIFGRPQAELVRDGWSSFVHPDDVERLQALVSGAATRQDVNSGELRVLRPTGEVRWIIVGAAPVTTEGPSGPGLVGTALDVTERREGERRMVRAQRLESIGTLTGGIAHDLNNALVPIIAGVSLLEEEPDAERRAVLADIERSAKRASGMVRQLLAFARGMDGQRIPVDLVPLLQELGRILGRTFPKNIILEQDYRERSAFVLGDPTQLHQVLLNLTVNARDAMPEGGRLVVRLETRRVDRAQDAFQEPISPGDYRVITVQDTGSGIEPEVLEHIFDPFFTTKEPDRGTGLGLSTTLGIIRGHQGHVAVKTELNLGTRFSVYLPAVAAPAPASALVPPSAAGAAGRVRVSVVKTTLVVDDEVTVRSVVTRSLQRLEMPCVEAGDGAQGLRVWEERGSEIGLLIVDLSMPVMDGVTMLRTVRRQAPDLPVIAFSGNITEEHRRELQALAVHKIMAKPFRYDDLVAAVREVLG